MPSEGSRDFRLYPARAASIAASALYSSRSQILAVGCFPTLLVSSPALRGAARYGLSTLRRRGKSLRRILLVGDATGLSKFGDFLAVRIHDYRSVGGVCPRQGQLREIPGDRVPVVGQPDDLVRAAQGVDADTMAIIGHPDLESTTRQEMARRFERSGRDQFITPEVVDLAGPRIRVEDVAGLRMLHITDPLIGERRQTVKTRYERVVVAVLLVLLSPVFVVVAVAILIDSGRQVLYGQQRARLKGRPLTIEKFRTMEPAAAETQDERIWARNEQDGAPFTIRVDPRVNRVGCWLCRWSGWIDEIIASRTLRPIITGMGGY